MPKKIKKPFIVRLGNKQIAITKQKIELFILILLVMIVGIAQFSGFYPYVYSYAICKDKPLEIRGDYYRLPFDKNYGIHPGSDYSRCYDGPLPTDLTRDPSNFTAFKEKEAARIASISDYTVYLPDGYRVSSYNQADRRDRFDTRFIIETDSGIKFNVSEVKKGSDFEYTQLCYKAPIENWSGTIIGKDVQGREICKTNLSKYIKNYIVSIYIGNTAIKLETIPGTSEDILNDEATKIFSSMGPAKEA